MASAYQYVYDKQVVLACIETSVFMSRDEGCPGFSLVGFGVHNGPSFHLCSCGFDSLPSPYVGSSWHMLNDACWMVYSP